MCCIRLHAYGAAAGCQCNDMGRLLADESSCTQALTAHPSVQYHALGAWGFGAGALVAAAAASVPAQLQNDNLEPGAENLVDALCFMSSAGA